MSFKNLEALTSLSIPDSGCFVRAPSEKAVALWVERNLQASKGSVGKRSQVGVIWFPVYFSSVKSGHHKVTCSPSQPGTYSYLEQFLQGRKKTAETNTWKLRSRQWCLTAYPSHTNKDKAPLYFECSPPSFFSFQEQRLLTPISPLKPRGRALVWMRTQVRHLHTQTSVSPLQTNFLSSWT